MVETVGLLIFSAIGLTAAGSFTIGATGITLASIVGGAVLLGGAVGAQLLLTPRPEVGASAATPGGPSLPPPETGHQALRQAISSRIVGMGRNRLAGTYVFFEALNGISYDIICFHHGKVSAILGFYLHDDAVIVTGGVVQGYVDGRYGGGNVVIDTRDGNDPEAAYTQVTSIFPSIWTANHRGDGLASLLLVCAAIANADDFTTIFPHGKPEPSVVADCAAIYDPRDPFQVRADETTWLVSSNPVLQIIDFLTHADRGMGFDWDTFIAPNLDDLMLHALLCDVGILKADGSYEVRYASNGTYPLDADPADVLNSMLDTCDGWLSQNADGAIIIKVGVFITPSVTLETSHIKGASIQHGVPEEEVVNELTMDYTEPLLDYKTTPGQPWRNEEDIALRGKVRSQRMSLPWVQSHSQSRRLAKRRDAQNNAPLRGTITTSLFGLECVGERWIAVQTDIPGLEDVVVENKGVTIDVLNGTCSIRYISVDPTTIDVWDPTTEEGDPPTIPDKVTSAAPVLLTNVTAAYVNFTGGNPFTIFYAIVIFDNPSRSDLVYQVRWRRTGDGPSFVTEAVTTSNEGLFPAQTAGGRKSVPALFPGPSAPAAFFQGHQFELQVRSIAPDGTESGFSASAFVSVPPAS